MIGYKAVLEPEQFALFSLLRKERMEFVFGHPILYRNDLPVPSPVSPGTVASE
jgi:hypothetical protein